jgi:hypothetical protein
MTGQRIGSYTLFDRLGVRFGIEPQQLPGTPQLLRTILPVTDVDSALTDYLLQVESEDLRGSGYVVYYTVPPDRRWTITRFRRTPTTGGSSLRATIAGVETQISLDGTVAEVESQPGIFLGPGDDIGMAATGNANDHTVQFMIIYQETILAP